MTAETTPKVSSSSQPLSVAERVHWGGLGALVVFGAAAVASRAIADTVGTAWCADVAPWLGVFAFVSGAVAFGVSTVTALLRRKRGSDVQ